MSENLAISVKNLSKVYHIYDDKKDRMKEALSLTRKKYHKDFHALNNISFDVKKGETLGIIGQNGSGKSTLLKILTGVLTQTSGDFQVNGKVSALLELGAGFNPEMTGMENIYLNGTIMGYTKEEMDERVPKITDFADIGDFIHQPVKMYSSGMFARLAFAVAINVEPDILIVDEALSVGDMFFQNKCFHKMEEIKQNGTTILFVSHDLGSIKQLCSKVLWLDRGIDVDFGDRVDICEKYLTHQINLNSKHNEQVINTLHENKFNSIKILAEEVIFPNNIQPTDKDILADEVKIISFFIKDAQKNITSTLKPKNNYTVHLIAEFSKDYDNLIFGVTMENLKGIPAIAINTFIGNNKKVFSAKKDSVVEVTFNLDLPILMSGKYLLSPAIAIGNQSNHKTLTWLHNTQSVNIELYGYNLSIIEIENTIGVNVYAKEKVILADI